MSCFEIYNTNLVNQATLTSNSANELFPLSNIKDNRRTKVFRSNENASWVVFDFNESSDVDTIFLLAEKRNGFGFNTATIQFNGTSNFASPAYSYSIELSETHSIAHLEIPKISYRFCRILMSSSLGYCELSKVYLGTKAVLSKTIKFGWNIKEENLSKKSTNRYGQLFVDIISTQKKIDFAYSLLTKDDVAVLNAILDQCSEVSSLWVKLGSANMSEDFRRTSGAYILADMPAITNTNFNRFSLSMSLSELT